jgi:hypothetical protein
MRYHTPLTGIVQGSKSEVLSTQVFNAHNSILRAEGATFLRLNGSRALDPATADSPDQHLLLDSGVRLRVHRGKWLE